MDTIDQIKTISTEMRHFALKQLRHENSKIYENAIVIADAFQNEKLPPEDLCASMRGLAIAAQHQSPFISAALDVMADEISLALKQKGHKNEFISKR